MYNVTYEGVEYVVSKERKGEYVVYEIINRMPYKVTDTYKIKKLINYFELEGLDEF